MTVLRKTGENEPYEMYIAPLNIYENQVLTIDIQNI